MKTKYHALLKDLFIIALGNLILAFAVSFFILPNNILTGGVAGLAVALSPIFKIEAENMINIIIISTYILGYLFLGKEFALKTLASTIMYPLFVNVLNYFVIDYVGNISPILASIYGGLLTGVGLGLTFKTGASTGGMDIPPLILEKYTGIKVSIWIMVVDAIVIILGLRHFGLDAVLVGFLSIFSTTFAIDKIRMIGGEKAKQVFIITQYKHEVLNMIHTHIDRGSTLIKAKGGFTGDSKELIMTVLLDSQYNELEILVKEIDPDAMLIVSDVTEVHGPGFYTRDFT